MLLAVFYFRIVPLFGVIVKLVKDPLDVAAALVKDGVLVAAAEEERFTRKKHDYELLFSAQMPGAARLAALERRAAAIAGENRASVEQHALFAPAVRASVEQLHEIAAA